jgi:hypothetical protein
MATMASVDNLIVQNQLRTSSQSGGTLHLKGTGSRQPAVEKALVVQGGASFAGVVTVGTLEVGANATVYGEVTADGGFGNVTTPAVALNGILTCPAVSTPAFAQQYFVAPAGSDVTGNGTVANPFATIGAGIAAAYAAEVASVCIVLAAGTYTEDVSIDSSIATDITIVGSGREETKLNGNIAIGVSSELDLSVAGTVCIMGLGIVGKVWEVSFSAERQLIIDSCNIESTNFNNSGPTVLFQCSDSTFETLFGVLKMSHCLVNCTGNNQNIAYYDTTFTCLAKELVLRNCNFTYECISETLISNPACANINIFTSCNANTCTFDLKLANDTPGQAFSLILQQFYYSPTSVLLLENCTVNLFITNIIGYTSNIFGVYTNTAYSYFIKNTFNVQRGIAGIKAVFNFGSTYTQGNVALPGSSTGFERPFITIQTI